MPAEVLLAAHVPSASLRCVRVRVRVRECARACTHWCAQSMDWRSVAISLLAYLVSLHNFRRMGELVTTEVGAPSIVRRVLCSTHGCLWCLGYSIVPTVLMVQGYSPYRRVLALPRVLAVTHGYSRVLTGMVRSCSGCASTGRRRRSCASASPRKSRRPHPAGRGTCGYAANTRCVLRRRQQCSRAQRNVSALDATACCMMQRRVV